MLVFMLKPLEAKRKKTFGDAAAEVLVRLVIFVCQKDDFLNPFFKANLGIPSSKSPFLSVSELREEMYCDFFLHFIIGATICIPREV